MKFNPPATLFSHRVIAKLDLKRQAKGEGGADTRGRTEREGGAISFWETLHTREQVDNAHPYHPCIIQPALNVKTTCIKRLPPYKDHILQVPRPIFSMTLNLWDHLCIRPIICCFIMCSFIHKFQWYLINVCYTWRSVWDRKKRHFYSMDHNPET